MSGSKVSKAYNLIRGTYFINNVELIAIIDTSANHLFISLKCPKRLDLKSYSMVRRMVIDTPTNGYVSTVLICSYQLLQQECDVSRVWR